MKIVTMLFFLPVLLVLFSCIEQPTKESSNSTALDNDDFYEKCRMMVVRKNDIAKPFIFKTDSKEIDELEIKYLGFIITSENDTLKVINCINFTGLSEGSRRANANLFLYTKDRKIGHYHLGDLNSLPSEIRKNHLVFEYKNEQCNQTTIVNLQDSIPTQIFINCTDKGGDLYTFEQ